MAEKIITAFGEERGIDKVWRILKGQDHWGDLVPSMPAGSTEKKWLTMPPLFGVGVKLRSPELGMAVAALLRKALNDVDEIGLTGDHVCDLPNVSDRLSREVEEARKGELLLDDATSGLGLAKCTSVARSRNLFDAMTLAANAPNMGSGIPARLRLPGGPTAARQAAKDVSRLQFCQDTLLSTVKLADELSAAEVRKHAEAMDRPRILSFMSRATKAAKRFYASIQKEPHRVPRKEMATVLGDPASFLKIDRPLVKIGVPSLVT